MCQLIRSYWQQIWRFPCRICPRVASHCGGSTTPAKKQRSIVFVLGGPGSGKGTQVGTG